MNDLYMLQLPVHVPQLLRFAANHGITREDETLGYTLHAWLTALFGAQAPKPFRYFEQPSRLLAYARTDAASLLRTAQAFALPEAWAALDADNMSSKPMPKVWRAGQRLRVEVLTCPVSRREGEEKDVYLRALDRLGPQTPPRAEVYKDWFVRQWRGAVRFERVQLVGLTARSRLLRRAHSDRKRLRSVERPQALFTADVVMVDPDAFSHLLSRGIGRHRAFGFGMVLLAPPQ